VRQAFLQLAIAGVAILFLAQPQTAKAAEAPSHNANGSSIFTANCVVCHGANGSGSDVGKSLHAPDLRSHKVQMRSNVDLARFIGEGSGAMPSFKDSLDRQQILDAVRYVRYLGSHSMPRP
jgi:mono/diheme cytochrome c family protein